MQEFNDPFCVLLGYTKRDYYGSREAVYLKGFQWDCGWYWGGGYIGNKNFHAHFDGAFLAAPDIRGHSLGNFVTPWTKLQDYQKGAAVMSNGCAVWEPITFFLDDVPEYINKNWWRVKDLYKQFYALREAAEVFQHGGHCTSEGRAAGELNKDAAEKLNRHIALVIIPEIRKALGLN